jgi:hypothetical protein
MADAFGEGICAKMKAARFSFHFGPNTFRG